MPDYGMRHGGAGKKGSGWLGPMNRLDRPEDVSTEISIGVSLNGKQTEIPLMVPGLDKKELNFLLSVDPSSKEFTKNLPDSIVRKAVDHAAMRIKQGKSPFKEEQDY